MTRVLVVDDEAQLRRALEANLRIRDYDVVFLNPPSYSRSHRMDGDFSVVRDQAALIASAVARLAPSGVLVFSTHARGFLLDPVVRETYAVEDVSDRSVPFDYQRSPHKAFLISRRLLPSFLARGSGRSRDRSWPSCSGN